MNIYRSIEYIKDFFSMSKKTTMVSFNKDDILSLASLCFEARYIVARNGKKYFYYVPVHQNDIPKVQNIMKKNGLPVKTHMTRYYQQPRMILRVPYKNLLENENYKKITDVIINSYMYKNRKNQCFSQYVEEQIKEKTK